ncbi:hypothetical protein BT69DRAFT_1354623 [Atractiella rhizophila]|nr:hypothetical protein BT69DRAFT_1354623 [Atractiella rhizophila]
MSKEGGAYSAESLDAVLLDIMSRFAPSSEQSSHLPMKDDYVADRCRTFFGLRYESDAVILTEAWTIFDRLGQANCIFNTGNIDFQCGQNEDAMKAFEEAKVLFTEVGARLDQANWVFNIAKIEFQWGWNEDALKAFEEAKVLYIEVGSRQGKPTASATSG